MKKINYYKDELKDSFTTPLENPRVIDENYKYIHKNIFYKIASFVAYRIIAVPLSYLYLKLKFHLTFKNKKVLKGYKKKGIYIYGNHTQQLADAFIPTHLTRPTKPYVIVHPDNVSLKVIGRAVPMLGALPLPDNIKATKNFLKAIEIINKKGSPIMIYPEAKIWPYYTKIRPFVSNSFKYPVKSNSPTFCITTTYHKRKNPNKVKLIVYVDGPFYPDSSLSLKEQEKDLRNKVYNQMVERAKTSDCELIQYVKIQEDSEILNEQTKEK